MDLNSRWNKFTATVTVCWLIIGGAFHNFAASTTVTVGSPLDKFSPAVVSINAGDQVIWNWAAANHSSTSGTNGVHGDDNGVPSGLWDSGVIASTPHTFTNTFSTPGNYAYYCQVHYFSPFFMTGAVLVASSTLPPGILITNPVSGAVFAAPANVTIRASVTNGSGGVTNVQFLVGANVLTNVPAAPFSATTNNLAAGSYTLSAIASDSGGLTATNSVSISVVTPVTTTMAGAKMLSGTNFQFSYGVNTGLAYVVQRSTNLISSAYWISLVTNTALSNPVVFMDTQATNKAGFYRVGRMPNP
jgi:plastocyanin